MNCNIRILIFFLLACHAISETNHDQQFMVHSQLKLDSVTEINYEGIPTPIFNVTEHHRGQILYHKPLNFKNSESNTTLSFSTTFVFTIIDPFPVVLKEGISLFISPTNSLPQFTTNVTARAKPIDTLFIELSEKVRDHDLVKMNDTQLTILREEDVLIKQSPLGYFDSKGELRKLEIKTGEPIQVWIEYDAKEEKLNVSLYPLSVPKPNLPLLSTEINLTPILSENMYVGISTHNDAHLSSHFLLGWSFRMNGKAKELDGTQLVKFAPEKARFDPVYSTWEVSEFEVICFTEDWDLIKLETNSSVIEEGRVRNKKSKRMGGMAMEA